MSIILQKRDLYVFKEIAECRFLTADQISRTCFGGRYDAAKKRLQKLTKAGFVSKYSMSPFAAAVYVLTTLGSKTIALAEHPPRRQRKPAITTFEHEIGLRDLRAWILSEIAARDGVELSVFCLESRKLSFEVTGEIHRPDGFFSLKGAGGVRHFFVEFDNGTEPYATLIERVDAYRRFYKSGHFAKRMGGHALDFREHPFQIVFAFRDESRLKSFLEYIPPRQCGILVAVSL